MIGGTAIPPTKEQQEGLKEWLEIADNMRNVSGNEVKPFDYSATLGQLYRGACIACRIHMKIDVVGQPTTQYLVPRLRRFRGAMK